jgi:hypothetical protein
MEARKKSCSNLALPPAQSAQQQTEGAYTPSVLPGTAYGGYSPRADNYPQSTKKQMRFFFCNFG